MAPKKEKKQQQTLSLGAFLQDDQFGGGSSWADEVEDLVGTQPLPAPTRPGYTSSYGGGSSSYGGGGMMGGYHVRDSFPTQLPDRPPYTAHLGNLSYEATSEAVNDFFADCEITSVRIIEDRIEQRPKGFAYAEFATVDGLKKALTLDGESFQGRTIRVKIADPPKDRGDDRGDMARSLSSWERKGPLADAPSRGGGAGGGAGGYERRPDFGERRGPPRDGPPEDRPSRDFGNWERKGPLSPVMPEAQAGSRESSRPDTMRKERKVSPATWGEGRQEGSRPPREFKERAERLERPERPERAPTAAEMDNQWRNNMKPTQANAASQSPHGSEAPTSPAPAPAQPASRPKLNLAKRTVSEAPDSPSGTAGGDSKASPFGAARPIDTAAKEREIADKKEQLAKEKKEADEKAKEEKRLAKEAEEKAAAEAEQAKAEAEEKAKVEAEKAKSEEKAAAPAAAPASESESADQKLPTRPKETVQNPKSRPSESGNWRTSSGGDRGGRGGGYQNARGRGNDSRGRGGATRGARNYENRPRANGSPAASQQPAQPASPAAAAEGEGEAATPADPDGWTTVPAKGRRNQSARA